MKAKKKTVKKKIVKRKVKRVKKVKKTEEKVEQKAQEDLVQQYPGLYTEESAKEAQEILKRIQEEALKKNYANGGK